MTQITMPKREHSHAPGRRANLPLWAAFVGASRSGKTKSAMRFAMGVRRVRGGKVFVIDTEAGRANHYADEFEFEHYPFEPPFSPLDYLSAIQYCVEQGATVVLLDSASHEHNGPGGVLEIHDQVALKMAKGDPARVEAVNGLAWGEPKAMRRFMQTWCLQMKVCLLWCFRAKEKIAIEEKVDEKTGRKKREMVPQGWTAIADDEFLYEMNISFLLLPESRGVPTWKSDMPGELAAMKRPHPDLEPLFFDPAPISEDIGESMAKWCKGQDVSRFELLRPGIVGAANEMALEEAAAKVKATKALNAHERKCLHADYIWRKGELARPEQKPAEPQPEAAP